MNPYCVAGLCGPQCDSDAQCPGAGQVATDAFCVGGACAECRAGMADCPVNAPVCDAGACRACALDTDCPSDACDVDTGMCVDASTVRYASATGADASPCTQASPCTMNKALSIVDLQHPVIRMLPGAFPSFTVTAGSMTIIAAGASVDHGVAITGNAQVTLRGLHVAGTPGSDFLSCAQSGGSASLKLRDVTSGLDVFGANCQIDAARCSFPNLYLNAGVIASFDRSYVGGVSWVVNTGETMTLKVSNSIATIVSVSNGPAVVRFEYDTFYWGSSAFPGRLADCSNSGSGVTFVNNLFYDPTTPDDAIRGTHCTFDHNVAYPQVTALPGTNTIVADPKLIDPATGNFHLQMASPAIDAAKVTTSDPTYDYDGTPRPQGPKLDIGAFEYKP
jgi:hypothetical protein